ncbi:magnesium/cobalt transporter CorA [Allohahella marinimesophila]|uniref:Magnesium transport protein CorA n=1 Tax=Allohahella marinimesophila TaxID=1054972 RepID=A0ABP7NEK5_9GAMM
MKLFPTAYSKPGTKPGTLSDAKSGRCELHMMSYTHAKLVERPDIEPDACYSYIKDSDVTWIHVQGAPDTATLRTLSKAFDIHELYLEDILNTGHRAKLEVNEMQAFIILSLPRFEGKQIVTEQVCLFLTDHTVVSFCSGVLDPFLLVRERIRKPISKHRQRGGDYLTYTLIDSIIDHAFPVVESLAEDIQVLEDKLLEKPDKAIVQEIYFLMRQLLLLRRRLWPQRDIVSQLQRDDNLELLADDTRVYLSDCYDHCVNIIELLETYHEITSGMLDLYLSNATHRLNEVMRVLTVISVLFMPPTFLVGVYGMNFDTSASPLNMPELASPYGYLFVWLAIISMMGGMLLYFRKKRWF